MTIRFSMLLGLATLVVTHGSFGQPTEGPSFDCQKAKSLSEKIICADKELSRMDRELAVLYKASRASSRDPQEFAKVSAEEWRTRERTCQDRSCLVQWYEKRKLQLTASGAISQTQIAAISKSPPSQPSSLATPAAAQPVATANLPVTAAKPAAPIANSKLLGEWWCKYGDLVLTEAGAVVKFHADGSMSRGMGIINLRFAPDGRVTNTYDDNTSWGGSWTEDKFGDGDKNAYLTKWNSAQFWAIPAALKGFPIREGRVFGGTLLCSRNK